MSVLKYFKNIPRSPPHRATGPNCIFFFKFATRSLAKKGACRPPQWRQGPVARWGGRQGPSPLYKPWPPSPLSFQSKNSGKKRGVRRRKAAKLCQIAYL